MLFGQQRYCVLGIASSSSAELFLVLSRSEHRDLSIIIDHTVSCSIPYKTPTISRLTASLHTVYRLIILTLTSLIILSSSAAADLPIAVHLRLRHPQPLIPTRHLPLIPPHHLPPPIANNTPLPFTNPPPTRFKEPSQAISQHDPRDRIMKDLVSLIKNFEGAVGYISSKC